MKMSKHTPGPWHHDEYGHICAGPQIIGIAYQFELDDSDNDELPCLENARLIAAAPEMYELLEQMEEDLMVAWACVPEEFARKFKQYSDNLKVLKAKIEGDEH